MATRPTRRWLHDEGRKIEVKRRKIEYTGWPAYPRMMMLCCTHIDWMGVRAMNADMSERDSHVAKDLHVDNCEGLDRVL